MGVWTDPRKPSSIFGWLNKKKNMSYDSKADTPEHIRKVANLLIRFSTSLLDRARIHDDSKLVEPEKSVFDVVTPKLAGLTYGSDEYKASLKEMGPALQHHYQHNRHHPEYFGEKGIDGMNLMDLVEMLMDWKAATERHNDGDIFKSIEINVKRFNINDQLAAIIRNTAEGLWRGEYNFKQRAVIMKTYVPIDFDSLVERSKDKPVLIDFYLDDCQPCIMLAPKLEKLVEERGFELVKINCDFERRLADKFNVRGVPRLILYNKGEVVFDGRGINDVKLALDKIMEVK